MIFATLSILGGVMIRDDDSTPSDLCKGDVIKFVKYDTPIYVTADLNSMPVQYRNTRHAMDYLHVSAFLYYHGTNPMEQVNPKKTRHSCNALQVLSMPMNDGLVHFRLQVNITSIGNNGKAFTAKIIFEDRLLNVSWVGFIENIYSCSAGNIPEWSKPLRRIKTRFHQTYSHEYRELESRAEVSGWFNVSNMTKSAIQKRGRKPKECSNARKKYTTPSPPEESPPPPPPPPPPPMITNNRQQGNQQLILNLTSNTDSSSSASLLSPTDIEKQLTNLRPMLLTVVHQSDHTTTTTTPDQSHDMSFRTTALATSLKIGEYEDYTNQNAQEIVKTRIYS